MRKNVILSLWILTKISILKAIHNYNENNVFKVIPVNPH